MISATLIILKNIFKFNTFLNSSSCFSLNDFLIKSILTLCSLKILIIEFIEAKLYLIDEIDLVILLKDGINLIETIVINVINGNELSILPSRIYKYIIILIIEITANTSKNSLGDDVKKL